MTETLSDSMLDELSKFHMAYETAAGYARDATHEAAVLSAAVGRLLLANGRAGCTIPNVNEMPSNWDGMEDAHTAFGELSLRDRVAEAFLDENGFRPTDESLNVILDVMLAIDATDEAHEENNLPGSPSYDAYARAAIEKLNEVLTS